MEKRIVPVILAGGSGTRLWPLSREGYPKQFCCLFGDASLLQQTAERANYVSGGADLIVVTNDKYYFLCKDQLDAMGIKNAHFILEPCSRNTAPAILLAAAYAKEHICSDATLLIMPSDHHLNDYSSFKSVVDSAVSFAEQDKLVVFGVTPTAPKTGYGYIEAGDSLNAESFAVKRFVEKPSYDVAQEYLAQGSFYWNSGMFVFSAQSYLKELERYSNDIYTSSLAAFQSTTVENNYFRVDASFADCRSASIDYEVMEKTDNAVVLPLAVSWNDLGCWSSVAESGEIDDNGNVYRGDVLSRDSQNCFLSSEERRVVAIGVKDQVIVSTPDAVLVADKSYSQDVKKLVEQMKQQSDPVATEHRRVYRPWGFYETLALGPGYHVKRLMVNPGARLSLQLHHHRNEHWVVVKGEAEVVNGEKVFRLYTNQSTYIDKETKHRLSNPTDEPLFVIEVQSGTYLGEDDIERFDDVYGRTVAVDA